MHHENTNLLNEVSKASKMGIDAIKAMSEYNVTPSKEK